MNPPQHHNTPPLAVEFRPLTPPTRNPTRGASGNALALADLLLEHTTPHNPTVARIDLVHAWITLYPEDNRTHRTKKGSNGIVAALRVGRAQKDLERDHLIRRHPATTTDATVTNRAELLAFTHHQPGDPLPAPALSPALPIRYVFDAEP